MKLRRRCRQREMLSRNSLLVARLACSDDSLSLAHARYFLTFKRIENVHSTQKIKTELSRNNRWAH